MLAAITPDRTRAEYLRLLPPLCPPRDVMTQVKCSLGMTVADITKPQLWSDLKDEHGMQELRAMRVEHAFGVASGATANKKGW